MMILQEFFHVLPIVKELVRGDITMAVCDREKYIFSLINPKINTGVQAGMPLKPGTAIVRAIDEGRVVYMRGDREIFGVPYIGAAAPIFSQEGQVVGAVAFVESVDVQDAMTHLASELSTAITTIASTMEEVSAQTQEVAVANKALVKLSYDSGIRVQETKRVLDMIKNVAGQTNLLGLNAAIEAARVGEQGRGFAVVANEIRNLADSSAASVQKIADIIKSIQSDSQNNQEKLVNIDEMTSQIAEAINHVAEAVQAVRATASKLDDVAESLKSQN
ncbi:methyl-accepting chemotaxis protein [Acetonema longum]|nr:methyl-accepting chemotaxis protein [Acetonema longum]